MFRLRSLVPRPRSTTRLLIPVAAVAAVAGVLLPPAAAAGTSPTAVGTTTLVTYRAAHHPGYDRVVFEFRGPLPERTTFRYVDRLLADGSGLPVRLAGAARLQVVFQGAQAHTDAGQPTVPARTGYALPAVHELVRAGDFEGYVTYGIGVSKATHVRMFTLTQPSRVVFDIATSYRWIGARVYFVDGPNYAVGRLPLEAAVWRPITTPAVLAASLHRLFAGPTPGEQARGLRLVLSGATGFSKVTLVNGVARVYLTGPVTSGGSTETIANLIIPTMRQFPSVRWVKIYDEHGQTEQPWGTSNSIPFSLEP